MIIVDSFTLCLMTLLISLKMSAFEAARTRTFKNVVTIANIQRVQFISENNAIS